MRVRARLILPFSIIFVISTLWLLSEVEYFEQIELIDDKWGDYDRWCQRTWTESFKLNHNTTRIIFHQGCSI